MTLIEEMAKLVIGKRAQLGMDWSSKNQHLDVLLLFILLCSVRGGSSWR